MTYIAQGKQVLRYGAHVADAVDSPTANQIADAMNTLYPDHPDEDQRTLDLADDFPIHNDSAHRIVRQNDEYACSCGSRWDVTDGEDHP